MTAVIGPSGSLRQLAELLSVDLQTGMTATAAFPPLAFGIQPSYCTQQIAGFITGQPRSEAQEVFITWGFEADYRHEDGKQRLYVDDLLNY